MQAVSPSRTAPGARRSQIPRDRAPDSTLALLADGYGFISRRCRFHGSDVFETRLMLQKVVCMQGEEAAKVLYAPERFTRKGAMPTPTLKLLQDRGSVQLLDGAAHRRRKRMFMSLMDARAIRRLADLTAEVWNARIGTWTAMDEVVLLGEVQAILCRAVCAWAGLPLGEGEVGRRTREFAAMIDGAGAIGPRNWRGMLLRARSERWSRDVVRSIRSGALEVPEASAAHVVARYRDQDGELLPVEVAAVELLNVLRPVVAVAHLVVFAALALHEHPAHRRKLASGDDHAIGRFVQEVRRFYPFFPCVGGRVQNAFDWRGRHFAKGTWVLLDLYGTNHDPRIWEEPEAFRPERFDRREPGAFDLIPQGGGDPYDGHRCAGEWITIELMKTAVRLLTSAMDYEVPEQDLQVSLSRVPTKPRSNFVITNVQPVA